MEFKPYPEDDYPSHVDEMKEIFAQILKDEEDGYCQVGITGDPDCPYRDWRGTPLEVGCTVVYATQGYSGGVTMTEAEVLEIRDKPDKKNSRPEWKFTLSVANKQAAGRHSQWKNREARTAVQQGKVKRQGIVAVDRVTVVF